MVSELYCVRFFRFREEVSTMNKEIKQRVAQEVLILLFVITCLSIIIRIWPIVLLALVGCIIAAVRMLTLKAKQECDIPKLPAATEIITVNPEPATPEISEQAFLRIAFRMFEKRIASEMLSLYPEARWLWDSVHPLKEFKEGGRIMLRLNRAGGYRKAWAVTKNLQFMELTFEEEVAVDEPVAGKPAADEPGVTSSKEEPTVHKEDAGVNYELLACDWVAVNIMSIGDMCNDAIAENKDTFLVPANILPNRETWPAVCAELNGRGEFGGAEITEDGIKIKTHNMCRKEII